MDYTTKTFKEHLDYMTNEIEKQPNNEYMLGRLEMAKDCKKLILSGFVKSSCDNLEIDIGNKDCIHCGIHISEHKKT
jgi:hypothetical protein